MDQLEETSARQCEKKLAKISPESALPKEKTRALTEEKFFIQLTVDKKLMGKLEKLKSLLSHGNPEGSYEKLLETLVELGLEKYAPERRQARRQKRQEKEKKKDMYNRAPGTGRYPAASKVETKSNRHIPQGLRDKVWLRDGGRCQYRDRQTGKICGSKHLIQIDHCFPYSLGGEHCSNNLRLLCFKHNQYHAQQVLGPGSILKKKETRAVQ